MSPTHGRPVVVVSNRGPVSFVLEDGRPVPRRGAGGLAASLGDVARELGATWIAAALSDADRRAAAGSAGSAGSGGVITVEGIDLRLLDLDPADFDAFYNGLANRVLWFCHHYLWDVPYAPSFGAETAGDWAAYRRVNESFAEAVLEASPPDATILVQDYHLALVPSLLRASRPDARVAAFWHIPFADPGYLRILPGEVREGVLRGLLGADAVGFHAPAWARNFLESCRDLDGARVDTRRRRVTVDGREVRIEVNPMTIDAGALRAQADAPAIRERAAAHRRGEQRLVFRADRMELSKNVVRGFAAFERLLETAPGWHGRVRFLAHVYPSRQAVPEYAAYARACTEAAGRVNERFGSADWQPVELVVRDDFDEVLAGYLDYDVLLVNPVFDGLNLVAKEGPSVNERDGVVVLSRNAGAAQELGRHALLVNPFDVEATAAALLEALEMPPAERRRRARGIRRVIEARPPGDWAARQL